MIEVVVLAGLWYQRIMGRPRSQVAKEREELRNNITRTMLVAGLHSAPYTHKALRNIVARDVSYCIDTELVPLAISVLRKTLTDDTAPIKERVRVAFGVLNRGGFPEKPFVETVGSKEIEAMTRDELHSFISVAEAQLAAAAKPVDITTSALPPKQVIDNEQ